MSDNTTDPSTLTIPPTLQGSTITDYISSITGNNVGLSQEDDINANATRAKYLKFTSAQLSQLIQACSTPIPIASDVHHSPTMIVTQSSNNPAYFNNAKYEDICCKPIKPLYDGSESNLMPFLLRLDIQRQDEGWAPATYVTLDDGDSKKFDLTSEFAFVTETDVIAAIQDRWKSATVHTDKHTIGHITCHARLLAECLLASIGDDFTLTLMNRIPQEYRNDGTYMLWAITNNIYRNNITFVENDVVENCYSQASYSWKRFRKIPNFYQEQPKNDYCQTIPWKEV
jgi:hypothetical protein